VLLDALARSVEIGDLVEVILVDDRPVNARTEPLAVPESLAPLVKIVSGSASGPAAARNAGWRAATYPWVAFLDDDVVPADDWYPRLLADLDVPRSVVGVQGVITVPLPTDRRPTDWERVTAGLAEGHWITADMAYRRDALAAVGGFDERFPRAFREDADVAWRLRRAGGALVFGSRSVTHPVRPERAFVSVRTQRGNADDALLRRLYGPDWRTLLEVPPGRRSRHALVTAAGVAALGALGAWALTRRRPALGVAAVAGAGWAAGTAEFAAARIAPGPRTPAEVSTMVVTSAVIPPLAITHWIRGWWRHRRATAWPPGTDAGR
jgi:cellulose synthase/poly-beta-1,6-N-acetylglucosamine synthase-like glycosyltransferase